MTPDWHLKHHHGQLNAFIHRMYCIQISNNKNLKEKNKNLKEKMPKLSWFILPLTLVSWWYGRVLYWESVHEFVQRHAINLSSMPQPHSPATEFDLDDEQPLADSRNGLLYVVQISDLHISRYKSKYLNHLRLFLNTTLTFINPRAVLVTGDLTDAKDQYKITSEQYRSEWVHFSLSNSHSLVLPLRKPLLGSWLMSKWML
jgi:hypothetical protein